MKTEFLTIRAEIIHAVRDFFRKNGYLEVDTPLLGKKLIPESSIQYFSARYNAFEMDENLYMIPSPEIWMKKLIADGSGNIFQICKSFRNGEPFDRIHNPEFTMLEYYSIGKNYMDSINITEELFEYLQKHFLSDALKTPFEKISMESAFRQFAGIELLSLMERDVLAGEAERIGIFPDTEDTWEQIFHKIFLTRVEPALEKDKCVVLYNYPARINTLAKKIKGTPWSERWEIYIRGIELANCYTEETGKKEVSDFFREQTQEREKKNYPVCTDESFPEIFTHGFPECSGVAMGIDRLIMLITGAHQIDDVIAFPFNDFL